MRFKFPSIFSVRCFTFKTISFSLSISFVPPYFFFFLSRTRMPVIVRYASYMLLLFIFLCADGFLRRHAPLSYKRRSSHASAASNRELPSFENSIQWHRLAAPCCVARSVLPFSPLIKSA